MISIAGEIAGGVKCKTYSPNAAATVAAVHLTKGTFKPTRTDSDAATDGTDTLASD